MLDKISYNSIENSNIDNSIINQFNNCFFENKIEDNILLNKIIKDLLLKTKNEINSGNYKDANNILKDYMTTEGFNNLPNDSKIDIIYYRAITLLNLGKIVEAKTIAEQILSIDTDNIKYLQFNISLNIMEVNREEFDKCINIFKEKCFINDDLETYEIKMLYNEKKYDEIIYKYVTNNIANNNLPKSDDCIAILISSLMIKNEYNIAKSVIDSIGITTDFLVYLKAAVNITEILKDNNIEINDIQKNTIDDSIILLESVRDYFNKNFLYKKRYYYYLLHALYIQNLQKCIDEYEKLDNNLKVENELLIIYIDSLLCKNRFDKAKEVIENIPNYTEELAFLDRIINILDYEKNYKKIINLLELKKLHNLDDNGYLEMKYIEALLNIEGFDETEKILSKDFIQNPLVNISVAFFLFNNNIYKDKIEQYSDLAIQKVDINDEMVVTIIAEKLEKMNLFEKCIQLLKKSYIKYIKTKILYIRNVIQSKECTEESKTEALKMVDEIIESEGKSNELLIYKGDLLRSKNRKEEAFKCYEEAFNIQNNYPAAYYCLSHKYESNDLYDIEKYINYLNSSTDINHMLILAGIYAKQKDFDKANIEIYSIMYNMKNNINMDMLAQIVNGIFFREYSKYEWKEYDRVENDTIVVLQSKDGKILKICIETDIKIGNKKEQLFDVALYNYQSFISNELLMKKINENVVINDVLYNIKSVTNKYRYIILKMRDYLFKNFSNNNKYGKIIISDGNNPLEDIMPFLTDRKNSINDILSLYRMKNNEIGCTINCLSKAIGSNEFDIIIGLLNDIDGMFYVGKIIEEVIEEYVITTNSLIILKYFCMDKTLIDIKDKIHIPESSILKLEKYFKEKTVEKESTSIGIGSDNKPYIIKNTETKIKNDLEFIRELISIAKQFKIEQCNYQDDIMNISPILSEEEQDAMYIAQNNNYTIIADDLCLRKIYSNLYKDIKHNNSMEFFKYLNFKERIEILEKISKTQYLFCINKDIIIELLLFCIDEEKIKTILSNLLKTEEKYRCNRRIIGEAFIELYKANLSLKKVEKLKRIIIFVLNIDSKYNLLYVEIENK